MSAKPPKSSVRIRKDTPIAMATSIASFPVTPYHKEISSPSEKNQEKDEISIKRRKGFDIFRRKVKTNLREKSTTHWNLSGLLKSTLPSMTKDVLVDNNADLKGLSTFQKLLWYFYLNFLNRWSRNIRGN